MQVFATPKRHHKSKPFFDHVLSFTVADGRIWMRNYQVVIPLDKKRPDTGAASLVEAGPRLCMNPIKIFAGSFGGATLFENPNYVSPNAVSAGLGWAEVTGSHWQSGGVWLGIAAERLQGAQLPAGVCPLWPHTPLGVRLPT
jgi:hypothetical protein